MPPSATLVWYCLSNEGELSLMEIVDQTTLNERTARYGLNRLDESDVVESRPDPTKPKRDLYSLTDA